MGNLSGPAPGLELSKAAQTGSRIRPPIPAVERENEWPKVPDRIKYQFRDGMHYLHGSCACMVRGIPKGEDCHRPAVIQAQYNHASIMTSNNLTAL